MVELDFKNITEPQFAEQATKAVEEMVGYNMISEAGRFVYNFNNTLQKYPNFNREYPDLYQKHQKLINYANYVALTGLTEEDIFNLFKNHFSLIFEILKINPIFDLIGKIRGFLVSMPIHEWRNSFKKDLINKLLENGEKITNAPLKDSSGKEIAPTIGNWLKDYQRTFSSTTHVDKVKQLEYLTNSQNTKNLSAEEKERLRHLFNLYEFLKLNSMTLDGLEEAVVFETENGKLKVLSGGRLEEIPVPVGVSSARMGSGMVGTVKEESTAQEPEPLIPGLEEAVVGPKPPLESEGITPIVKESIAEEEVKREEISEKEEQKIEPEEPTKIEQPAEKEKEVEKSVVPEQKEPLATDLGLEEAEKEVKKFAVPNQKEKESILLSKSGLTIGQAIDEVIKSLELSFSDETAERRFKNILQSYLNGVRDQIDTLVVLKRPVKIGGMGFDESKAEEVLWLLKDIQAKLIKSFDQAQARPEEIKKIEAKTGLAEGLVRAEDLIKKEEIVEKSKPIDKEKFEAGPLWQPPIEPSPAKKEPGEEEQRVRQIEKEEMLKILEGREDKKSQPKTEKETVVPIRRPFGLEPGKRVLEDVKMRPRIYGPLEELKTIKLADWRSWGSPQESVNRVQDKIEFLAEESLIKKAQGIKAWQSSEVYRLYLEIGEEALEKQQSVETIVKLREKGGRPYLTPDEFNKISELNQKLRF